MYDTVIIGAGMSGLAAGIRLAHFDQRVCILERHFTIGGLNSFYRLRGRNYDVGLHAVTNFAKQGDRSGPLARLLRQLRFRWEDFALRPQVGSTIVFPGARLDFSNNLDLLRSEIRREFPGQVANFERLLGQIIDYDELEDPRACLSAREMVASIITEPLLVEMLFCPVMYYGAASENDVDFGQFSIMFRSIFMEGLARPRAGVRLILKNLVRRFRSLGGELRLSSGVAQLMVEGGKQGGERRVGRVVLDSGEVIDARNILSSAGWVETMRLLSDGEPVDGRLAGNLSFSETISTLNVPPATIGFDRTIVFFNDRERFDWSCPDAPCSLASGVICSPNNFAYETPLDEGTMRVTVLANYGYWTNLNEADYRLEKLRWYDRIVGTAARIVPDFRGRVIDTDMFTPKTITRFTGHAGGAVYGSPQKHRDGRTHLANLFICGTDQGLVGIIGSIISGITMANRWCLR
jgi:phytoene dehydrogenase-like protein